MSTLGGIFSHSWTSFNETHHIYSLPGPYNTDDIFKVICSKVKVTDNVSPKMHFSSGGILINGSPSKTV